MKWIIYVVIFFLIGCVHTAVVTDAEGNKIINSITMSCKKPYVFTQDCSAWSGATRKITIDNFDVVVAGSEDGSTILVMDSHSFTDMLTEDPFILNKPTLSRASNNSFYAVKRALEEKDIIIQKVTALGFMGDIDGYVLELDTDGYQHLIGYTME
ncbi:MAG: hypothetical protein ACPGGM_02340 [Porticoccaceae bacterium]